MSSIGSLPFLFGAFHFGSAAVSRGRRNFRVNCDGFSVGKARSFRVRKRESLVGLRATGKSGSFQEEGEEREGVGRAGVGDDALRATIDKSNEILAIHSNLLQQIAKRKNIVSSIRSDVTKEENDSSSYVEKENLEPSSGEQNGKYKSGTVPNNYSQLAQDDTSENPLVNSFGGSPKDNVEAVEFQVRQSALDAFGRPEEPSLGTTKILSPFYLEAESDGAKEENAEDLVEAKLDSVHVKDDLNPGEENEVPLPLAGANVMNIIVVAAECAPWSKTGGLGDVAGALPKALARRGHRVMVVAPRYGNYAEPQDIGVRKYYKVHGQDMEVTYFHAYIDGVDFVFMDSPDFRHRENRIYEGNRVDILKRMILFCKAAVEVPWHVPCGGFCYGDGNLAFITNDWHTALLPVYLKAYYRDNGLMKYARSVLVIHNIAHQGRGPVDDFKFVGLPDHYLDLFRLYDPVGGEHLNIFAAGLKTADRVVTVSHGYAWELKTSEGGWGLHEIINESNWKFQGIVNGIDAKEWSPEFDVHLKSDGYTNYSLDTLEMGKPVCKAALQREVGLPVRDNVPIIAFIGRLDHQKGVDLIAEAMPWIVSQDVQVVMLGTGRQDLENLLRNFEGQHRDKVRAWVAFSVKMAHRITAGADILMMPSRFEPCGLNQLYAMMYGTIPVVHAVGGLRDTVTQFDPFNESGLGWTFDRAEAGKLIHALSNCLNTYWNYKDSWKGLQTRGMMQDLSWDNAAQQYEDVLVAAKYQW